MNLCVLKPKLSLLLILIGILFLGCSSAKSPPKAVKGVLDLGDWDFDPSSPSTRSGTMGTDGIINLDGEWEFYLDKFCLFSEETIDSSTTFDTCKVQDRIYTKVPGYWDEYRTNSTSPEKGYGTYRLIIHSKDSTSFALKMNTVYSARDVYINGKKVSSSVYLSKKDTSTTPKNLVEIISPNERIHEIVIHVSNHFESNGGMIQSPEIGNIKVLEYIHRRNQTIDIFIFSALIVIGIYHIGLFLQRNEELMYLYYGLTCIILGIRQTILGSNTIYYFFPDFSWYWGIKIAHLSFYLTIIFFTRYIISFYNHITDLLYRAYQSVFIFLSLILFIIPLKNMNKFSEYSTFLIPIVLIQIVYIIFKNRHLPYGRTFLNLFFIFCLFIINDILFFLGIIQSSYLSSLGFLIFFLGQANLLSSLFSRAFTEAKEARRLSEEQRVLLIKSNQELELTKERATRAYLDLEASQKQLVQSDKMITLGTMVAGVAHEINTPLGAIKANSENILDSLRGLIQKINPTLSHITIDDLKNALFILELSKESRTSLSSREARAIRKKVMTTLTDKGKINIEVMADYILELGLAEALEGGDVIFENSNLEKYLSIANDLYGIRKKSTVIQTSAERVSKIVKSLKSFMHFDQNETKIVSDLTEGMETVLIILHNKIKYGIEVIKNYGENVPQIPCYPDELNQVWTNLIHNAIQAMGEKGTLQIDIERLTELAGTPDIDKRNPEYKGGYVAVSIQDSGSGISPEIRTKIFQAFFTTKPAGEGSGLGLHIIGKILEKHEGALYLESEPGRTRFTVLLPEGL